MDPADLAVAVAGGAVTTVYASTGADDVAYILSDSDTRIIYADNETQVAKLREKRGRNWVTSTRSSWFHGSPEEQDGDWSSRWMTCATRQGRS